MPEHPDASTVEHTHRELLQRWRGAMNLVGPGSADIHFKDSNAVARLLEARGRWADLGSGAGFPGVAIAARHPQAEVSLVESRSKRAAFLQRVVQQAGLPNATVFHGRVQELEGGCWDGIISRAFAAPEAEHGRRLLQPGGRLCLMLAREQVEPPPDFRLEAHHDYRAGGRERRLTALVYIG